MRSFKWYLLVHEVSATLAHIVVVLVIPVKGVGDSIYSKITHMLAKSRK